MYKITDYKYFVEYLSTIGLQLLKSNAILPGSVKRIMTWIMGHNFWSQALRVKAIRAAFTFYAKIKITAQYWFFSNADDKGNATRTALKPVNIWVFMTITRKKLTPFKCILKFVVLLGKFFFKSKFRKTSSYKLPKSYK